MRSFLATGFVYHGEGIPFVSPLADRPSLLKMGIKPEGTVNVGEFSEGQRTFLDCPRENVLKISRGR